MPWLTVVGVVGRIKQDRLDAGSRIALYHPAHPVSDPRAERHVRSRTAVASLAAAVRRELRVPSIPTSRSTACAR